MANMSTVVVNIEGKDRNVVFDIFKKVVEKQKLDDSRGYLFVDNGKTYCFDACFLSPSTFYFMTKWYPFLDDFKQITKGLDVKINVTWEEFALDVNGYAIINNGEITAHRNIQLKDYIKEYDEDGDYIVDIYGNEWDNESELFYDIIEFDYPQLY